MPKITIETCDSGALLNQMRAEEALSMAVVDATRGKLPAESSDLVVCSIEAIHVMRAAQAYERRLEAKRQHAKAVAKKASRRHLRLLEAVRKLHAQVSDRNGFVSVAVGKDGTDDVLIVEAKSMDFDVPFAVDGWPVRVGVAD